MNHIIKLIALLCTICYGYSQTPINLNENLNGLPNLFQNVPIEQGMRETNCNHFVSYDTDPFDGIGNINELIFANDLIVEAGKDFTLETIVFNAITEPNTTINSISLSFYAQGANGPGNLIGTASNLSLDNVEALGIVFGDFDRKEITVELDEPFLFPGSSVNQTYWIGILLDYTGESSYLELTTPQNSTSEPFYLSNQGWMPISTHLGIQTEGVMSFYGECMDINPCTGIPSAGTIQSPPEFDICPNTSLTLSATGYTRATDLTFQWESRLESSSTWTEIPGSTSPILHLPEGIEENTYFRMTILCVSSQNSATTPAVMANILCYCEPSSNCGMGHNVNRFVFVGASETIDNSSPCSPNGYDDFTYLPPADVYAGGHYSVSVTHRPINPFFSNAKVWIDFNQDGDFSSEELVGGTNGLGFPESNISAMTVTIPENLSPGFYRLRVRVAHDQGYNFTACSQINQGATQDYLIEIVEISSPCTSIQGGDVMNDFDICHDTSFTLVSSNATSPSNQVSRIWERSSDGSNWEEIDGAYSSSYTLRDGISQDTYFRYKVTCNTSSQSVYSDMVLASISPITSCYCTTRSSCNVFQYISEVKLVGESITLLNPSTCTPSGYADYTHLTPPDLLPSESYNLEMRTDYDYTELQGLKVWIDYNLNGVFDNDELIFSSGENGLLRGEPNVINFQVPNNLDPGLYRVRLRLVYSPLQNLNFGPCEYLSHGETEDYYIEVLSVDSCDGTPEAGVVIEGFDVCQNSDFDLVVTGAAEPADGLVRQWQKSTDQEEWIDIPDATSRSYRLIDGIEERTFFRYKVYCENSDATSYSDVLEVGLKTPDQCPCIVTANCFTSDPIQINQVILTGHTTEINNSSGCNETGDVGYSDYTNLTPPDLKVGPDYELTIKSNYSGPHLLDVVAWIDFNKDGVYTDDEIIATTNRGGMPSNGVFISEFSLPDYLEIGEYRMRIRIVYNPMDLIVGACNDDFNFGEIEDYTVLVDENLGIHTINNSTFSYYPNPVNDVLYFKGDKEISSYSIYNSLGQIIIDNAPFQNEINISSFTDGFYFIKLYLSNGEENQIKIIKK